MSVSKNNPLIKIKRQFACRGAHFRILEKNYWSERPKGSNNGQKSRLGSEQEANEANEAVSLGK